MNAREENDSRTNAERKSDRELVVTRTFDAPARIVFDAWTKPELLQRWWTPKSFGIVFLSCEIDARTGGRYRFVFKHGDSPPMEFFGRYLEVTPPSRLVWTNEEAGEGGAITTVTFEEQGGSTRPSPRAAPWARTRCSRSSTSCSRLADRWCIPRPCASS